MAGKRKASGPDWEAIKVAYLAGGKPRDLVERFGVTNDALKNRIIRGKWAKERQEVDAIAAPERRQKIADVIADEAERATRDQLALIGRAHEVAASLLGSVADVVALKDWASAYKSIQACQRLALGLDKPVPFLQPEDVGPPDRFVVEDPGA